MLYNKLLVVLGLGLVACAPISQPVVVKQLPCPVRPLLPLIMETELEALSDDAYRRLVERELRLKEHIRLLEAHCE